jgi:hypothetical protein
MDVDPVMKFYAACGVKEERGVQEHRGGDASLPFVPDDYRGIQGCYEDEQLDSANYLAKMLEADIISAEAHKHALKMHFDLWFWINGVMERG